MNKNLFKSIQTNKEKELNKLWRAYHRMDTFNNIAKQYQKEWRMVDYDCFWSWYYHSDISAYEALEKLKED